jgi:c-mer proto-oncogene tyrosine kinase/anaplastic lymphoma kinase
VLISSELKINRDVYSTAFIGFLEPSLVNDLLEECTKMMDFNHPNVLTLIGVCLDGGPAPFIVMPFMHNGSLVLYLKKERKNLVTPPQQQLDTAIVGD